MTEVKPFIKCVDFWPDGIPPDKLKVYKQFIEEGQIVRHNVLVNRHTNATTLEYFAIAPHEWMLQEMAARCAEIRND